ncbi:MAG TPA: MFS transporter [Burkholderiales bacterium]|jgi:predicted MFS family arabinose efflux permease
MPPTIPLILMMVLVHLTYAGCRVGLQLYALSMQASPVAVGVLMSLLAVVPMFLSVHVGRLTDRIGPVKPALIAITGVLIGSLLPAIFRNLPILFLTSVVIGTCFIIAHIAVNNAVGHTASPENRTQAFSHLALGFSFSSMMGPVITGFSIDWFGHVATFIILASFSFFAFFVWLVVRARMPAPSARASAPGRVHVMDLLRMPHLRAVFIVSGMISMGWDLFNFMVPLHGSRLHLSASTIGTIMGCMGIATFAVRAGMPWIARRFSEWQALTGSVVITAVVYFLFPLFSQVPVLMVLAFILGLGLGGAQPMVMTLLHATSPAGRAGEAVGLRTMVMNASSTVMPLLIGTLGVAIGVVPAFWLVASTLSATGVFAGRRIGGRGDAHMDETAKANAGIPR